MYQFGKSNRIFYFSDNEIIIFLKNIFEKF